MLSFLAAVSLWICSARSLVGHYYSGQGATQAEAQDNAMKACQANSAICYPTRCEQAAGK